MITPTPLRTGHARAEPAATRGMWVEIDGPFRLKVKLATVAIFAFGLILFITWITWDQNRLIASQQGEIRQLQEYIRHLEERLGILNEIQSHRPSLLHEEATVLARAVQEEAWRYDLDWRLLLAIIRVESGFDPRARSPRGAIGLMQVMPAAFQDVASELGWNAPDPIDLEDLQVNVRVGTHYLFSLLRRFGDLEKAVRAYYLGPSRITNASDEWERRGRQYLEAVTISQSWLRCAEDGKEQACLNQHPTSTVPSTSFPSRKARFRS